jgi:hypothetical protein
VSLVTCGAGFLALNVRLPPVLEHQNQLKMRELIYDEVWYLLDEFSRDGKHTPADKRYDTSIAEVKEKCKQCISGGKDE